ncbi:hypothetical protein FQN54_001688 [Arachnomyces sp. PD_36]|nr:hypothetical protein FQN54_001688 [Arachnomyces sp. PD_36]
MPYIPHTPESLVGRADAPGSATPRCNGITSNGQQCRRAMASANASPSPSPSKKPNGLQTHRGNEDTPPTSQVTAFYCWQHKQQEPLATGINGNSKKNIQKSKTWTSIDSLADRLGVLEVNEAGSAKKGAKGKTTTGQQRAARSGARPQNGGPDGHKVASGATKKKKRGIPFFFCFQGIDDENIRPPRRSTAAGNNKPVSNRPSNVAPVPQKARRQSMAQASSPDVQKKPSPHRPTSAKENLPPRTPERRRQSSTSQSRQTLSPFSTPNRPSLQGTPNSSSSQTQSLLSLIPPTLSPQTTAALLSELAKPISDSDTPGYIYIFLGASANSSLPTKCPSAEAVTSALATPPKRPSRDRSVSDIFQPAQTSRSSPSQGTPSNGKRTVILKIGRTSNVHRRLNEWIRQCSLDLTLIRYYPYTSSSSSSRPSLSPGSNAAPLLPGRKAPHIHRVERLIHLELAERRAKGQGSCETCGKEHRELFEIEANVAELRVVDECIRRWVGWAERQD